MTRIVQYAICSGPKKENLMLLGRNICKDCEKGLVQISVDDWCYPMYLEKMKEIVKPADIKETSLR